MGTTIGHVDTLAHTSLGAIRGNEHEGTAVFKGIRYATASRFCTPEATGPWEGELDATRYGAQCHQLPGTLERLLGSGSLPFDEDCLFLNVFTPSAGPGDRPVLVWIHGGAFNTGSGAMPWYHGSNLVRRGDVVVVTINYRLGALGFLDLPDGVVAGPQPSRNAGLLDQLAALRWVQEHIAAFGGDPGNVTIFGESAGGASVVALLAAPGGGRAVLESPGDEPVDPPAAHSGRSIGGGSALRRGHASGCRGTGDAAGGTVDGGSSRGALEQRPVHRLLPDRRR